MVLLFLLSYITAGIRYRRHGPASASRSKQMFAIDCKSSLPEHAAHICNTIHFTKEDKYVIVVFF